MNLNKIDNANATSLLIKGELLLYPTETVYGMGCDATNLQAIQKIFEIKQRDQGKPLPILVDSLAMLKKYVAEPNAIETKLIERYWPGPLTILFQSKGVLPKDIDAGTGKIAARISSHPIATQLVKELGRPLVSTSANLSEEPSALSPQDLARYFSSSNLSYLDGGVLKSSKGSTLVEVVEGRVKIIRQGDLILRHFN